MHYERFAQQTGGRTEVATRTIAIKSTQAGTDSRSLGRFVTALVCMAVMAKMGIRLRRTFMRAVLRCRTPNELEWQ
jgi:hypothetical protein